jgi:hypothetical protein
MEFHYRRLQPTRSHRLAVVLRPSEAGPDSESVYSYATSPSGTRYEGRSESEAMGFGDVNGNPDVRITSGARHVGAVFAPGRSVQATDELYWVLESK